MPVGRPWVFWIADDFVLDLRMEIRGLHFYHPILPFPRLSSCAGYTVEYFLELFLIRLFVL